MALASIEGKDGKLSRQIRFLNLKKGDFPGGPVAKTLHNQCRGHRFNPWSGNEIPHAATESSQASNLRSCMPQLRPSAVSYLSKYF